MNRSYCAGLISLLFLICFTIQPLLAQDDICSATGIGLGATIAANNTGASQSGGPLPACFIDQTLENDIWFTFIAPASGGVNVTTVAGTLEDSQVAIYSSSDGTCSGALTEVGCSDDISTLNFMSSADACGLSPGSSYFIQVDGWEGAEGSFDLTLSDNPDCATCDPAGCDAGELADNTQQIVCPGDQATFEILGFTLPQDPVCQAQGVMVVEPADANAGGGPFDGDPFLWTNVDMSGAQETVTNSSFQGAPLTGLWEFRPVVTINGTFETCNVGSRFLPVYFYQGGEGPCPSDCIAGEVLAADQVVCPGESIDLSLSEDHNLPFPGLFYWYFENASDPSDSRLLNFGDAPEFYQFIGDINALLATNGQDTLTPGQWFFEGANLDLADTTFCDATPTYLLTILGADDPLCSGLDCSVYESAPTDLTKSFNPVQGVQDRVQVKWYKSSPQVRYSDQDAAMCDIKAWAVRTLDPISGAVTGIISSPDTISLVDRKKTYGNGDPREIFKWPLFFRADDANNANRVEPNTRYRFKVRCECGFSGDGLESPWSEEKTFNTPDFDPSTGVFGGKIIDTDDLSEAKYQLGEVDQLILTKRIQKPNKTLPLAKKIPQTSMQKSIAQIDVDLYPNPVEKELSIAMNETIFGIIVRDMTGRIVMTLSANDQILRIDVSALNAGIYVAEIEHRQGISRREFIVK